MGGVTGYKLQVAGELGRVKRLRVPLFRCYEERVTWQNIDAKEFYVFCRLYL